MTNDPKINNKKQINKLASYSSSRITSCFFWSIFTEKYHDYLGFFVPISCLLMIFVQDLNLC